MRTTGERRRAAHTPPPPFPPTQPKTKTQPTTKKKKEKRQRYDKGAALFLSGWVGAYVPSWARQRIFGCSFLATHHLTHTPSCTPSTMPTSSHIYPFPIPHPAQPTSNHAWQARFPRRPSGHGPLCPRVHHAAGLPLAAPRRRCHRHLRRLYVYIYTRVCGALCLSVCLGMGGFA